MLFYHNIEDIVNKSYPVFIHHPIDSVCDRPSVVVDDKMVTWSSNHTTNYLFARVRVNQSITQVFVF